MSNFYLDVIRKDSRFGSTSVIKDMGLLEPGTRAAVIAIITDAKALGHLLVVTETYRSQARQAMLFAKKATQLRTVGVHGYGLAVDFAMMVNGKMDPVGEHYAFLAGLCAKHGMISGADWGEPKKPHSFRDWDHIQRVPVFRQSALFADTWYPPADYDPYADLKAHG